MGSNPTVTIPIGTSDPVDLSAGLPLFPGLGTARAGIAASARSYKLFDIPILIVCTRLKVSLYAGYGFGIVGPAIAFLSKDVTLARENIGDEGQLNLTFNNGLQMQAGAFVGAYISGGVTAALQVYLPRPWWKVWAFTWQNVFTINKDFQIDLLALMSKLIEYLLTKRANAGSFKEDTKNKLAETKLGVKSFGMEASSSGVRPDLRATPEVTAPLNLANYVPKLREINQALAKINGGISFGPTAHLQYPVTFNFDGFTVAGGVQGAPSADYRRNVQYRNGNQVTARGNTPFNTRENPSRLTTHVRYQTSVRLAISIHAEIKVAKFFSLGVNTPSLDLTFLLFRRPESSGTVPVENSISTAVEGGCVLTPNMTLRFKGPEGLEILTGQLGEGSITLAGFRSTSPATVALEIEPEPRAANFPNIVRIPAGSQVVEFPFTFQNQCLATGNRNDPSEMVPPSAIAPLQTYRVRATLLEYQGMPCSDYQAETPLSITNRFIRCQAFRNVPRGFAAPAWDPLASGRIHADEGVIEVGTVLWFPYFPNESTQTVPVTFTLLDENRQPYPRSDVEVFTNAEHNILAPSCTLNVALLRPDEVENGPNLFIRWSSKGQPTGYSNLFYVVVNAGCQYGQTEFWLDVFNWS